MQTQAQISSLPKKETKKPSPFWKQVKKHWQLYIVFAVPLAFLICFSYIPMYGIIIAFKDFTATQGIFGSPWAGMKYFNQFFNSYQFVRLLSNTLILSVYGLIAGFPIPILLALSLNECKNVRFKKAVQMVTYAPYFISTVVLVSIMSLMLAPKTGLVNHIIVALGGTEINFMGEPTLFRHLYVWSGVWQSKGFSSVIYIAALAGIDPTLHEAAVIDGASKIKRIWHIDLPGIAPTIIINLILNTGSIMSIGYEKVLLMQNSLNMSKSDIIATYVYRIGLEDRQYSLSTAVNLFNSVINCILLVVVNQIARKFSETSLW